MFNGYKKVTNLESFIKQLPKLSEKMDGTTFYRGQSNISKNLTPSVLRNGMISKENDIYTEIITECAHEFDDCKLHNEILSKMQHYGVPTRLLDITANPLVALYYACDKNPEIDGVVYVLRTQKEEIKRYDSDSISILSSLPRLNNCEKDSLSKLAIEVQDQRNTTNRICYFNNDRVVKRLLHEIKKEKPAFENIIDPKDILSNFFFIPRKVNARIIRQNGAFIIFGLGEKEIRIEEPIHMDYMKTSKAYKILIDNTSKETIINQLSCFGISKATLHPELYKVAEFINHKYNPEI